MDKITYRPDSVCCFVMYINYLMLPPILGNLGISLLQCKTQKQHNQPCSAALLPFGFYVFILFIIYKISCHI